MRIEELRELSKAASPGPWSAFWNYFYTHPDVGTWQLETLAPSEAEAPMLAEFEDRSESKANVELIVAMRNHIDALLAVAEAARSLVAELPDDYSACEFCFAESQVWEFPVVHAPTCPLELTRKALDRLGAQP